MVGRQTPLLALFVPLILVFIVDRKHGIRDTWPAAVVCGVAFAIVQFVAANYISVPLTDILASLLSAGAVVLLLRVWQPARTYVEAEEPVAVGGGTATAERTGAADGLTDSPDPAGDTPTGDAPHRHRPRYDEPVGAGSGRGERPGSARQPRRDRPGVRAVPDHHRRLRDRPAARYQAA